MRKKRRVELHIEHREISVYASAATMPVTTVDAARHDGAGLRAAKPLICPTCGSQDMVAFTDAVSGARLDPAALNLGMQNGRVHFHLAPSGEWWICTQSLHKS